MKSTDMFKRVQLSHKKEEKFVVVLGHSNSISVISWGWYDAWDKKEKPKPTLLLTQGIFNLPHHIGMVLEELTFDDAVSYTQQGN